MNAYRGEFDFPETLRNADGSWGIVDTTGT